MANDPKQPEVINLGGKDLDPKEEEQYLERIRRARAGGGVSGLKGNEPPGTVPRPQMPSLSRQATTPTPEAGGPVRPRPAGSPVIRPETQQQLEAMARAQEEMEAQPQKPTKEQIEEEREKEEERLAKLFSAMDFGDQRNRVEQILDNKKRRKEIESRCEPMKLEDLIMNDEVVQRVPIIPGKFEPLFRSITPVESLYLKARLARETVQTDQYIGEKYNLMLLVCCLVDINKTPLPDHRKHTSSGFEVDDKLFDEKLAAIMRKSGYIVADLTVNYNWFDIRVRRLLNPEELGNG